MTSTKSQSGPTLDFEWDQRIMVAVFSGEIDLAFTDAFLHAIVTAAEERPLGVVLDLVEVTYLDSAGVRLLFLAHRELQQRRIPVVAVPPRQQVVGRILVLAEVPSLIPLKETRSEALAHLKLDKAATTATQLQHALDSRVIIEQAKGILAERHRIDLEEAFERMRLVSRRTRRPVRDVAADVVARTLDAPG